jgi:hypothetical protein
MRRNRVGARLGDRRSAAPPDRSGCVGNVHSTAQGAYIAGPSALARPEFSLL